PPSPNASLHFLDGVDLPLSLHSFPTRRSSDLSASRSDGRSRTPGRSLRQRTSRRASSRTGSPWWPASASRGSWIHGAASGWRSRSEEHTAELQSRENLVCRLLLANNKTNRNPD